MTVHEVLRLDIPLLRKACRTLCTREEFEKRHRAESPYSQ